MGIAKAARTYLRPENLTVVGLGPAGSLPANAPIVAALPPFLKR